MMAFTQHTFFRRRLSLVAAIGVSVMAFTVSAAAGVSSLSNPPSSSGGASVKSLPNNARVAYLHHSTGQNVWTGGVPQFIQTWNSSHGKNYQISELRYPATIGGHTTLARYLPLRTVRAMVSYYPWENYPYDYWNLWIAHTGESRDRGELNLDDLVKDYDVIVFKHCFPVSGIKADSGTPSVSSKEKTLANYKLQYEALKTRMHQFPEKRFILWTGPALTEASTNPQDAERARQFVSWVKTTWDEKGDNIYLWDFYELETKGALYLKPEYADGPDDAHPNVVFSRQVALLIGQRIVDVIEGRGDLVVSK